MNNLDSLSLKYFFKENVDFIKGAIVQKIQQPSRYELVLVIRNLNNDIKENKKLYVNINPKYPHICFINKITEEKRNIIIPKKPPAFCMQLRKYLNGSKIQDFRLVNYERILEFDFCYFDEIGSLTNITLTVELMGKHSNIILYNSNSKIILGSIHNISEDKSSIRQIYGGIEYFYPPIKNKENILSISYSNFYEIAKEKNIDDINNSFYYLTKPILKEIFEKYSSNSLDEIFIFLQNLINLDNKDFIISFWDKNSTTINNSIDEYFSNILKEEITKSIKNKLKSILKKDYKKLSDTIKNPKNFKKEKNYKELGDLIMTNLYKIKKGDSFIEIDNIKIELDENLSPSNNAQKYYNLYKKEKTANEYKEKRFKEAKIKLEYFENILFSIENSDNYDELEEIKKELLKLDLIKNVQKEEKKEIKINKTVFMGYEVFWGKNNIQNDYLISKIAKDEDLWFHGQGFPSSHIILKIKDKSQVPSKVLEFCAKLTKENSKAKFSNKVPIIYTKRKNLKKPPDTYPGYVTYKDEKEIVIK